jgi:hypothetical protein
LRGGIQYLSEPVQAQDDPRQERERQRELRSLLASQPQSSSPQRGAPAYLASHPAWRLASQATWQATLSWRATLQPAWHAKPTWLATIGLATLPGYKQPFVPAPCTAPRVLRHVSNARDVPDRCLTDGTSRRTLVLRAKTTGLAVIPRRFDRLSICRGVDASCPRVGLPALGRDPPAAAQQRVAHPGGWSDRQSNESHSVTDARPEGARCVMTAGARSDACWRRRPPPPAACTSAGSARRRKHQTRMGEGTRCAGRVERKRTPRGTSHRTEW